MVANKCKASGTWKALKSASFICIKLCLDTSNRSPTRAAWAMRGSFPSVIRCPGWAVHIWCGSSARTSQDSGSCYLPAWLAWWVAFKLMVAIWLLYLQSSFQAGRRGSLKDKTAKLSPCDIWFYIFEEKSFSGTFTNIPLAPSHPAQDGHMMWGGWQIKFLVFQTLWWRW